MPGLLPGAAGEQNLQLTPAPTRSEQVFIYRSSLLFIFAKPKN